MSRSRRKPFLPVVGSNANMNKWKKIANRTVRRKLIDEDIPNGKYYKRYEDDWGSPKDGTCQYVKDAKPETLRK